MADSKLQNLNGGTASTPGSVSVGYMVNDPTGTPTDGFFYHYDLPQAFNYGTYLSQTGGTINLDSSSLLASYIDYQTSGTTSAAAPAPQGDAPRNLYQLTALNEGTATFAAPSGTPADWNMLLIRIIDSGSGNVLAHNAIYQDGIAPLLTSISGTASAYELFVYDDNASKWTCLSSGEY